MTAESRRLCFLLPPGQTREILASLRTHCPENVDLQIIRRTNLGLPALDPRLWRHFSWRRALGLAWHRWRVRPGITALAGLMKAAVQAPLYFARFCRAIRGCDSVIIYNGHRYNQATGVMAAKALGKPCIYWELGQLPGTLVFDRRGINARNSAPRRLEELPTAPPDAPALRRQLAEGLSARTARQPERESPQPLTRPYLFVPFQVEDDTQIAFHSPWIHSMDGFYQCLQRLADHLPRDYQLVIKEHPNRHRDCRLPRGQRPHPRIRIANGNDSIQLLRDAAAVMTINSSLGLQALLFDCPVILLGEAFFGFEPLAFPARSEAEAARLLERLPKLRVDSPARDRFIAWLYRHYYVPGRLRQPLSRDQAEAIWQRLLSLTGTGAWAR